MRTLVIGGAGCGKSEYAEKVCVASGRPLYYIATMQPFGAGAEKRIARHQKLRKDKGFQTLERYTDLALLPLEPGHTVLLECLGNLAANELFRPAATVESAKEKIQAGIASLERQSAELIVVSNDVFCDGIDYTTETQAYIDLLGQMNTMLSARFDRVVEVVCNIPVYHKGESP